MKKLTLMLCAVCIAALSSQTYAQTEEEMKAWMDYMTPGDIHNEIAKWDGEWAEEMTMWMAPDAPPQKYDLTCVNEMVLGGRYQTSVHKGNFGGMDFEGRSTLAYDNIKKKLISTWIDNMGTGLMVMEGTWDPKTKTANFKGMSMDPMSGKEVQMREVFTIVDDKTQKMEMYMTGPDGKEYKSMEILLKKK